jgi:hypothetical protein
MAEHRVAAPLRKRGAQPGNKNALKHGFYSRYYRRRELNDRREQPRGGDRRAQLAQPGNQPPGEPGQGAEDELWR